jgi:hypothetical protein
MSTNPVRQYIRTIITEAMQSEHYTKRVFIRFVDLNEITVGYEITGTVGKYTEVGTYILPQDLKNKIIENTKIVEDYSFPKNKSYAVKIADILIDYNKIKYFSETERGYVFKNKPTILFLDSVTESNGNQIYAIIRSNNIVTAYFAKSYSMANIREKMRVDVFVKDVNLIKQKKIY